MPGRQRGLHRSARRVARAKADGAGPDAQAGCQELNFNRFCLKVKHLQPINCQKAPQCHQPMIYLVKTLWDMSAIMLFYASFNKAKPYRFCFFFLALKLAEVFPK